MMPDHPPRIRTDTSNAFAHHTMRVRVPETVRRVLAANPDYPAAIHAALAALAADMEHDAPLPTLALPAPDADEWGEPRAARDGHPWLGTDWFFAETFAYRLIIQATRWWETGRDPFAPIKAAEEKDDAVWEPVERALRVKGALDERLHSLLHHALWGNRIDLSFAASMQHGLAASPDDLLVDDGEKALAHLLAGSGPVHILADNVGRELAADLALADALLGGVTKSVVVHLKMFPTFVSDATRDDLLRFLYRTASGHYGVVSQGVGQRLYAALQDGRLRLAPDLFWNGSRSLWEMPPRLERLFVGARLVILKGDLNYRRMVGDALWPPETPLAEVAAYFPAPLLALRALKSDPIVGLPPGLAEQLDGVDADWRTNGKRGVIQGVLG